ncbi:MAG: manganese efflux pump [Lachnospiraceae bacterium]|nr:manganese efflux pump [Lachnospiraceae bacterium]
MTVWELFLIAVGLSMDAFAVSIVKGLSVERAGVRERVTVGLWFGGFQALMPFLGWLLGAAFADRIARYDHWVAFILLGLIGANMVRESLSKEEEHLGASLAPGQMFLLAVATSIDALAVGVTFAFLKVAAVPASAFIGVVTFLISCAGVGIGHRFGSRFKSAAELAGGIILIGIGAKILIEHLFL